MNNPHPDTDRLRYEIEAKTRYDENAPISYWPNEVIQFVAYRQNGVGFYYNSEGGRTATFSLKAWK